VQQILFSSILILDKLAFLLVIAISLIYRRNRELNPIRFYFVESLIGTLIMFIIPYYSGSGAMQLRYLQFNIGGITDLIVIYYYFWSILTSDVLRRFLEICFVLVILICIYFLVSPPNGFYKFLPVLYGILNFFIIIPCLLGIYELFRSDEVYDLKINPHFYISCAFLFFYGTTFPFYMTFDKLYHATPGLLRALVGVESSFRIIMYLTIMKAFLCPYPAPK